MARLKHIVSFKVFPVHGGLGTLNTLGRIAFAVHRSNGFAEGSGICSARNVTDEGGHVHLVGTTDGFVDPEPA